MQGEDHVLCGWRVRSALPLPELMPWSGPADHAPDVVIVPGTVPSYEGEHWVTVDEDGAVRLSIRDVVRIRIAGGSHLTVDILREEAAAGWRRFLLGAAFGYLCHQRGVFPLHAATLTVGGRTVALAGESGAGKSTLAFALTRRGHALLSDDLTVLRTDEAGAEMLPAFPRLKLWQDTLHALNESTDGLDRVRDGLNKFDLSPHAGFDPAPRRLDAIYVLRKGSEPILEPVTSAAAVPLLCANIVRSWVAQALGRQRALFAEAAAIARHVPVMRLARPMDFDRLTETALLVETSP